MNHSTRPAILLATAAAVLAVVSGCAKGAAANDTNSTTDLSKVTLTVGDQKAGSRALLTAAGLLDKTPYRVEWKEFTSGPPLLEAINAGAVDVGGVGDTPPIFAASADSKITIVAANYSTPKGSAILVPKNSPITDLAGLKGKKIALSKGSSANAQLLAALTKVNLTFNDITPAYLQPSDALAAFSNGSIDAWTIWDPYTALAQEKAGARILVDGTNGLLSGLGFQVAAPAALKDKGKEAALRDYLTRLAKARAWTQQHNDEWSAAWAKEAGIPVSVAKTAVQRAQAHAVTIDDALVKSEQSTVDAFAAASLIPKRVDINTFIDRRFNDTATAN